MADTDEPLMVSTSEPQLRGFAVTDLVTCPTCTRANAPTRFDCLYCGSALGTTIESVSAAPESTPGEAKSAEAFHVVGLRTGDDAETGASARIAGLLGLTESELGVLLRSRVAPLRTTTTAAQAHMISEKLKTAGIATSVVSDAELKPETPAKEIASLTINNDCLVVVARRTGERISVRWDDIVLIVMGRLYFTTTEVEQKRNRSKKVIDERQWSMDEAVLALYVRGDDREWRIRVGSFDFSCLGSAKKFTAFENFQALTELLRTRAANASWDDHYVRARGALGKIWPPEPRASSTERRRTAIRDSNATATVSDNELQFTRYSRLQRLLPGSESENDARQT